MKNTVFALFITTGLLSCAQNKEITSTDSIDPNINFDRVALQVESLPEQALYVLEEKFPGQSISKIDASDEIFKIGVSNHSMLHFDLEGQLISEDQVVLSDEYKEVDINDAPSYMIEYIAEHYGGKSVISIQKNIQEYVVELSHDVTLNFPK